MPEMGVPAGLQTSPASQARMLKTASSKNDLSTDEKQKLLSKITGQRPEDIYYEGDHNKMGKDEFLKLLTHQLQNQDPLNPMEQNKFAGELAQFSQLEQLTNLNTKFDKLNQDPELVRKVQAATFLGKKVTTSGNSTFLPDKGKKADVIFSLDKPADQVMIRILDKKNNIVSEMWKEDLTRGQHNIEWNGERQDGMLAQKGTYKVQVKAWSESGQEVSVSSQQSGVVKGVGFKDGEMVLDVGDRKVFLRDVSYFGEGEDAQQEVPETQSSLLNPSENESLQLPNQREKQAAQGLKSYEAMRSVYD